MRYRRRRLEAAREAAGLLPAADGAAPILVLHASQTGQAEDLAWQSARALHAAGVPVRLAPLGEIRREDLRAARQALIVTSTYGEGDPPDSAAEFARQVMGEPDVADLGGLHCGVLAMGDNTYRNFCGFGRTLDAWLRRQGAQALFERIDVDKSDAGALTQWRHHLARLAGTSDLPGWEAPIFEPWRLAARRLLNPGSSGEPAYHIELESARGTAIPAWQSGDLAQVRVSGDPDHPREYSIASLPSEGRIHLLVRRSSRADGGFGLASGWLTAHAGLGEVVPLRVRPNRAFRLGDNAARPLILIGNGTGMAGLLGHLKARARSPTNARTWLIFGERQAAHDAFHREQIAGLALTRADWVFSRDQPEKRYVQYLVSEQASEVRAWVDAGAAIYVCGSLEGMAGGVNAALGEVLGEDALRRLTVEGRYRRDVY